MRCFILAPEKRMTMFTPKSDASRAGTFAQVDYITVITTNFPLQR